MFMGI